MRCPRCSAPIGPEQDWCLECGAPARTRLAPTPNWQLPTVAIARDRRCSPARCWRSPSSSSRATTTPPAGTTPTAVAETAPPAVVTPPPVVTPDADGVDRPPRRSRRRPPTTVPGQTTAGATTTPGADDDHQPAHDDARRRRRRPTPDRRRRRRTADDADGRRRRSAAAGALRQRRPVRRQPLLRLRSASGCSAHRPAPPAPRAAPTTSSVATTRARQRAEVVAALEHDPQRHAELVGASRASSAAIAGEAGVGHPAARERVVGVRVVAGRHAARRSGA